MEDEWEDISLDDLTEEQQSKVAVLLSRQQEGSGGIPLKEAGIKFLLYIILPFIITLHVLFFIGNIGFMEVTWIMAMSRSLYPKSFVMIACIIYGFMIASTIFYLRQRSLIKQLNKSLANEKGLKERMANKERELHKLKQAAAQIVVPYRLDTLVDRGLVDFMEYNSKTVLKATPSNTLIQS